VRAVDELIDYIVKSSQVPSGKRRGEIQRELRSHVEDFVAVSREAGHGPDEIEKLVLTNFGDPGQIAQDFAWVYRHERRRLRAFAYTTSTVLLASSLLAAILVTQAGLAFSFGTPIMLVSRHTLIEALDILASVAAYLGMTSFENIFDSYKFPKATFLLTVIFTILMVSFTAAGLHMGFLVFGLVNGFFFRTVQLFITPKLARLGIVAICFSLAGLVSAHLWSSGSDVAVAETCISWFVMGVGYQLMTHLASRIDAALLNGFHRIRAN
jgi:hypothetical protein